MFKRVLLFLFFGFGVVSAFDLSTQKWLMTGYDKGGRKIFSYAIVNFNDDILMINDINIGKWKWNKDKKTIVIESKMSGFFSGEIEVVLLKSDKLILKKGDIKLFFVKFDINKMEKDNAHSGFLGVWKVKTDDGISFLRFDMPNNLLEDQEFYGGSSLSSGKWIFDGKNLLVIDAPKWCRGKNKITKKSYNSFQFENRGNFFEANRVMPERYEKLTFDSDKLDSSEDELPRNWKMVSGFMDKTSEYYSFEYRVGKLLNKIGVFVYHTVSVRIMPDYEKGMVEFIFVDGDKKYSKIKKEYNDNYFFPENDIDIYKVKGKEKITTPAGTFDCTVVEAVRMNENKVKFWMIDNIPGVYAKIITETAVAGGTIYKKWVLNALKRH